jgi:hypothetical protein
VGCAEITGLPGWAYISDRTANIIRRKGGGTRPKGRIRTAALEVFHFDGDVTEVARGAGLKQSRRARRAGVRSQRRRGGGAPRRLL